MYKVIAYHGKGREEEIVHDMDLLRDSVRRFARRRKIEHVYCFQHVADRKGADLLLVLQYNDSVSTKLALRGKPRPASQIHNHTDYWCYVRERNNGC